MPWIAIRAAARIGTALAWVFLVAIVLAVSSPAKADDSALLEWHPPTENEDGSKLTDLAGYRINYGSSPSNLTVAIDLPNPGLTSYRIEGLSPGTYYFGVRAVNAGGVESRLSNIASKTIAAAPASKPVYVIKQTRDNLALVVVGHVPASTQCAADKGVIVDGKAYYVVPRDAVTWAGSVQSEIVVGECN